MQCDDCMSLKNYHECIQKNDQLKKWVPVVRFYSKSTNKLYWIFNLKFLEYWRMRNLPYSSMTSNIMAIDEKMCRRPYLLTTSKVVRGWGIFLRLFLILKYKNRNLDVVLGAPPALNNKDVNLVIDYMKYNYNRWEDVSKFSADYLVASYSRKREGLDSIPG